jgi:uncharacterized membrane protein
MNGYLMLHLLGAILFVGNIVTAAFWKTMADRSGQPAVMRQAARNVMLADWVFTVPGLALLIVSGSIMAAKGGYSLSGLNWLTLSLALFAVTAIIWLAFLIPLQRSMVRLGRGNGASGSPDSRLPARFLELGDLRNVSDITSHRHPVFDGRQISYRLS